MDFSSHIQHIVDSINNALTLDKKQLVPAIQEALQASKSLLETDWLDFWITQLNETHINELPLTHYGLKEARRVWKWRNNSLDPQGLSDGLVSICEYLFTYCHEDDLCENQGQFHFYFYIPENKVFKESRLGSSNLRIEKPILSRDIRIARKSELSMGAEGFV